MISRRRRLKKWSAPTGAEISQIVPNHTNKKDLKDFE